MWRYILSRVALMVPTFLGILIINFAVMRLQAPSLTEALMSADGTGERRAAAGTRRIENHLDRFRRTGNDLPALVNLRGFLDRDDLVTWLEDTQPRPGVGESTRNRREKELWLAGRFAVAPLAAVLADPALTRLHPAAIQALALCAYTTVEAGDFASLGPGEAQRIQARNDRLRTAAEAGDGAAMIALANDFPRDGRWGAILGETGFSTFIGRLVTGTLWSETRKDYVFSVIADKWQVTCWLSLISIVLAWVVSIPLGIRSARRQGTIEDRVTTSSLLWLWSLPSFFVGTLLLHHLCTADSGGKPWFPNAGLSSPDSLWLPTPLWLLDLAWHAALPIATLTYASFTSMSRYMRGNLLGELHADYARTARAKGCSEDRVVYGHCLRNSLITMITLAAGLLAELFGGVLIVEMIFSIPGLGLLLLEAARQQDAPLLMGATVVQVGLLLVGILIADVLYGVVDPRLRGRT
jgi:ABC-type dipeptide/oligopeptide/nickel transport system permease component